MGTALDRIRNTPLAKITARQMFEAIAEDVRSDLGPIESGERIEEYLQRIAVASFVFETLDELRKVEADDQPFTGF